MTPQELRDLASAAGVTVHELTNTAMRAVMVADPCDPRYSLAYAVWQVGQEVEAAERTAELQRDGWIFYPANTRMTTCPNGHEPHLTGGKRPVWTCGTCNMTQVGYAEDNPHGYYLRWQEVK